MNNKISPLLFALGIAIAALALLAGPSLALGETGTSQGFDVTLVDFSITGKTSTWTYAVTSDGLDELSGLSHIVFGVDTTCGYRIVAPQTGPYNTLTNIPYCTDPSIDPSVPDGSPCELATYQVEHGYDPTTRVSGVKFMDPTIYLEKSNPATHVFRFTLERDSDAYLALMPVGIKTGVGDTTIQVVGPSCNPTAVQLTGLNGSSATGGAKGWLVSAGSEVLLLGLTILRKKRG